MKTIQIFLTVAAGKALIAKGLASREDVQTAMNEHSVLILKGTTNGYLAEELLRVLGIEGFSKKGFFRGVVKPADARVSVPDINEDLLIRKGQLVRGNTVFDVIGDLGPDDIAFKGVNAVNLSTGRTGILVGNPTAGTIGVLASAAVGRRVRLIHPVGVEKRVSEDIGTLTDLCNDKDTQGLRLFPSPGKAYTELDAFKDLFMAQAKLLAGGGVGGYEGGCYFLVTGEEEALAECRKLCAELNKEPLFEL